MSLRTGDVDGRRALRESRPGDFLPPHFIAPLVDDDPRRGAVAVGKLNLLGADRLAARGTRLAVADADREHRLDNRVSRREDARTTPGQRAIREPLADDRSSFFAGVGHGSADDQGHETIAQSDGDGRTRAVSCSASASRAAMYSRRRASTFRA